MLAIINILLMLGQYSLEFNPLPDSCADLKFLLEDSTRVL